MTVRNDWVGHLRRYTLRELRRRQSINEQQIQIAYKTHNADALVQLQNMNDSLAEAVYLNEFAY